MDKECSVIACWNELNCTDLKWITLQGLFTDTGFKIAKLSSVLFLITPQQFPSRITKYLPGLQKCLGELSLLPCTPPTLPPTKRSQSVKKKNMLGKCPKNITLMAVYMHYGIARYHFHHPPPTHRFSSSLCPRASTSFAPPKGLKSVFQVYRPSPFSPILKKSNHAPRSNDLNYLSRQNLLRVYRPSPQKHTHIKFSIEIQGVPRI